MKSPDKFKYYFTSAIILIFGAGILATFEFYWTSVIVFCIGVFFLVRLDRTVAEKKNLLFLDFTDINLQLQISKIKASNLLIDKFNGIYEAYPNLKKKITTNVIVGAKFQELEGWTPSNGTHIRFYDKPFYIGEFNTIKVYVDPKMTHEDLRVIWDNEHQLTVTGINQI